MIIHDFECEECGTFERLVQPGQSVTCECGRPAHKVFLSKTRPTVDADWIKSVLLVVDKDSDAPHCREFLKHPTRANYHAWMKGENIRPLEPGEKPARFDRDGCLADVKDKMKKAMKERTAITLYS